MTLSAYWTDEAYKIVAPPDEGAVTAWIRSDTTLPVGR